MGFIGKIASAFTGGRIGAYGDTVNPAASQGRELGRWVTSMGSADTDAMFETGIIRSRARDLDRSEALVKGFLDSAGTNVIGSGLRCKPMPDYRALGKTAEWAADWSRQVRDLMTEYIDSTDPDVTRYGNLHQVAALMLRSCMLNGSALGVFYWVKDPIRKWRTCLRLVESDRLRNPYGKMDTPNLRGGIVLSDTGEHLAYTILKHHPGDVVGGVLNAIDAEFETVPKMTPWGRRQCIYLYDKERVDQNYGISWLSAVIPEFKLMSDIKKSELQAAYVSGLAAIIVESQGTFADVQKLFDGDSDAYFKGREKWYSRFKRSKMGPGGILSTMPGDKVTSFAPGRPNNGVVEFLNNINRYIATGLNLPLETIDHNWTKLNYSAARTVILDAQRTFRLWRSLIAQGCYQPVYVNAFEEAVFAGLIPDCTPENFYVNKHAWTRCVWGGPSKGWVDEGKEATAALTRMTAGLTNLSDECDAQGLDWRDVADQRKIEMDYFAKLQIPYPPALAPVGTRMIDPIASKELDPNADMDAEDTKQNAERAGQQ